MSDLRFLATAPWLLAVSPVFAQTSSDRELDVIELSPFAVTASEDDIGYHATNTLAGTRVNSAIRDLGAPITVVTKQQLEDTGAVDVNDIFLYEASTEGTGQFTSFEVDRSGGVLDRVALSPHSANRVRGIGSADLARDYFVTTSLLPIDSYNLERVTINRGPNSILFGLGSPSGIVNQTMARASTAEPFGELQLRVGRWGSHRGSFHYNQPVLDDTLAVRVAGLYDERGFTREPSHDRTRRLYGAVLYQPFSRTNIRFNIEDYDNDYRRPNSVTPRDFVTPYREAGSPSWDPTTYTATLADGTTIVAPANGDLPPGLQQDPYASVPAFYIEKDEIYPFRMQRRFGSGYPGLQSANQAERTVASQHPYSADSSHYLLYVVPGVTDRSIYDWKNINITSGNHGKGEATVYNAMIDHQVTDDLFVEAGWYHEEFDQIQLYAQGGGRAAIYIDPNERMLDGTVNPYFGKPYIESYEPTYYFEDEDNDTYRATVAYDLDFAESDQWHRWLGRHNLMGLLQRREQQSQRIRWREAVTSSHAWTNPDDIWASSTAQIRFNRRFYVGDANGNVTHAPGGHHMMGRGEMWNHTLRYFQWEDANGAPVRAWRNEEVVGGLAVHQGETNTFQHEVDSISAAVQSYFWNDRIVTTFGWRKDKSQARSSLAVSERLPNGQVDLSNLNNFLPWEKHEGTTLSKGVVYHALPWLSFHYNESDNFSPEQQQVDLWGEPLPLPQGEGKDYGFTLSFADNRFVAKFNWYEAAEINSRTVADTLTIVYRARRVDTNLFIPFIERQIHLRDTGEHIIPVSRGEGEAIYDAEVAELAGLPESFFDNSNINYGDTATAEAEGFELNLVYNPRKNWNIKFNIARQEAVQSQAANRVSEWIEQRMDYWTSAVGVGDSMDFWTTPGSPTGEGETVPQEWYQSVVAAPLAFLRASEGKPRPQIREWRANLISNYLFTEGDLRGLGVGGAVRWESKASIGFRGIENENGVMDFLDPDQPIYDEPRNAFDFWVSYSKDILAERVRMKVQLNLRNAFENGGLEAVAVNPDGSPSIYRIVDPREVFLTTTFSF